MNAESQPDASETQSPPVELATDREVVESLAPVEPREILEALVRIPIETWNYKFEDQSIRHIGPMAQDFYAAFGLGDSDEVIYHVDAIGICMSSIKGLYTLIQEQAEQITQLQEELDQQATQIEKLRNLIQEKKA